MTGRAPHYRITKIPPRRIVRQTIVNAIKGFLWDILISLIVAFFVWFFGTLILGAGIPLLTAWRWGYIGFGFVVVILEIVMLIQLRSAARHRQVPYALMWEASIVHRFHRKKDKRELGGRALIAAIDAERHRLSTTGKIPRVLRGITRPAMTPIDETITG